MAGATPMTGLAALATGFTRLLVAPGVQFNISDIQVFAQVGFPVYQRVNGNQIVAPEYYKFSVGYSF